MMTEEQLAEIEAELEVALNDPSSWNTTAYGFLSAYGKALIAEVRRLRARVEELEEAATDAGAEAEWNAP